MASKTAMVDTDNMKYFSQKLNTIIEDFKENTVWLNEILEEAERMFISDFNAEPELMPKTPSERKRRRRRPSVAGDHNKRFSKSRKNLRRSSAQRKKLGSRLFTEDDGSNKIVEQTQSLRLTRSATRAALTAKPASGKDNFSAIVPVNGVMPLIVLSPNDCKVMELQKKGHMTNLSQIPYASEDVKLSQKACEGKLDPSHEVALEILSPVVRSPSRRATKVKIAEPVTDEENEIKNVSPLAVQELNNVMEASTNGENCISATETKGLRRSVRRSVTSRQSKCMSLVKTQQSVMLQRSMRKSSRKFNRKDVLQNSSSCQDKNGSFEGGDERECEIKEVSTEDTSRIVAVIPSTPPELQQPKVVKQPDTLITEKQERRYTRNATKHAVNKPENEVEPAKSQSSRSSPRNQKKDSSDSDKSSSSDGQSAGRKRSYKYAVANSDDYSEELEKENSPPRKKTPSPPPFTTNKVVQPKHKSFLHTVQKNQLLMTPVSVGRTVVKSFIKRNTPLKVDPKDQERVRLENHKKKREQEEERIQKVEEQKKRKVEEYKKKREMQVRRFLETRTRVQQQEVEKIKKIEQKFAQIDEKNAKVREERFAEKGKKKLVSKRMEEAEARRRQEEEARKQKLQQLEEERQIMLQQKKQEELEHQRKMVEARKLQEQRQAELERERQREHQLAAERERERIKEQEKIQAEKERACLEKKRALQLQRELERAALQAEREKAEREKVKQEEKQLAELERQRLEKEKIRKEQEIKQENEKRNRENEERKWKEEQDKKAEKEVASKNILNVTVEVHHTPPPESYAMTPNAKVKIPKVNLEDYGMDLNSDDSTDDEGAPRKPIPVWASGKELQKSLMQQYYHPIDLDKFFGVIQPPNLESIFSKSKPRYLKRTSSAVWHSPPLLNRMNVPYCFKKY